MQKRYLVVMIVALAIGVIFSMGGCGSGGSGPVAAAGDGGSSGGDNGDSSGSGTLYKVSVEVSGLGPGESVVLQNNGADDLQVDHDGVFTFATGLADGASYKVSVSSQPVGCVSSVTNGSGTIAGADPSGILVRIMRWSAPASIGPENVASQYIGLAMNKEGEAIVVWAQIGSNGKRQITKSEYRNGVWHHPADRDDNISPPQSEARWPQVAMAANGDAVIAWQQKDANDNWQVLRSEYRNGVWHHPADLSDNISPDGSDDVYGIRVAMAANGDAIIVWRQKYANNTWLVYRSEYRSGTWDDPDDQDDHISFDSGTAFDPDVAMAANGDALVVWSQYSSTMEALVYKSEYRSGAWIEPADENDHICPDSQIIYAYNPSVAMTDGGDAVISWKQRAPDNYWQIYKSEYRDGAWHHPADDNQYISSNTVSNIINQPVVALEENGNALIVWKQKASSGNWQIYKSEYRNGAWHHPADADDNISPDGDIFYSNYRPALAGNGDGIIVWDEKDAGGLLRIYRSEYRNGAWSHPADLDDHLSGEASDAYDPQAAMSGQGEGIIVWWQAGDIRMTQCR